MDKLANCSTYWGDISSGEETIEEELVLATSEQLLETHIWQQRATIFEKTCAYLALISLCPNCAGKCLVNMPEACFATGSSYENLNLIQAITISLNGDCCYTTFTENRKDWKTAPKNSSHFATIPKASCKNLLERLSGADLALRIIRAEAINKVRDLPPCGWGLPVLFSDPSVSKIKDFIEEWILAHSVP
jgi:hypothetical protein